MKRAGKIFKRIKTGFALGLTVLAVFCAATRAPKIFGKSENAALAAAAFTLTDGRYRVESSAPAREQTTPDETVGQKKQAANMLEASDVPRDKSDYYDSFGNHDGENVYPVVEKYIGADGTAVGAGYIKNRTGLDLDFNSIMNAPLTFKTEKNSNSPQVLIYHTHTGEAYLDEDVDNYYESYYSRTQNNSFNVTAVGDKIALALERGGIKTLHDKTVHDSTYNGSYDRSAQTVLSDIEDNKSIKVTLDIHRDALGGDDYKVKPVFEYEGKKAAQIMILAGCDPDNERNFTGWRNNLSFALKIQNAAESMFPGMTRPVSFDYFAYNEYISDGSLLIEIGSDANSIDEAEYAGELLGKVLAKILTEE